MNNYRFSKVLNGFPTMILERFKENNRKLYYQMKGEGTLYQKVMELAELAEKQEEIYMKEIIEQHPRMRKQDRTWTEDMMDYGNWIQEQTNEKMTEWIDGLEIMKQETTSLKKQMKS